MHTGSNVTILSSGQKAFILEIDNTLAIVEAIDTEERIPVCLTDIEPYSLMGDT